MEDIRQAISNIKRDQWIFSMILSVIALLAWFAFYAIVYQVMGGVGIWIISATLFLTLAISVGLSFFLLKPQILSTATYLVISLLALFFFGWRGVEIFGVLALFVVMVLGRKWVGAEQERLIPFWYTRLIRKGMPIFFTGLAFTLALFYNTSPAGRVSDVPQIPRSVISVMLIPTEYILRIYVPEFRKEMTIGEVERLDLGIAENLIVRFPSSERTKNVTEFFTDFINLQIQTSILPYKQFLPFVYLFGLFLIFKAIAAPFMWISIGAGWFVMKILLRFKRITLHKVDVQKEELIL